MRPPSDEWPTSEPCVLTWQPRTEPRDDRALPRRRAHGAPRPLRPRRRSDTEPRPHRSRAADRPSEPRPPVMREVLSRAPVSALPIFARRRVMVLSVCGCVCVCQRATPQPICVTAAARRSLRARELTVASARIHAPRTTRDNGTALHKVALPTRRHMSRRWPVTVPGHGVGTERPGSRSKGTRTQQPYGAAEMENICASLKWTPSPTGARAPTAAAATSTAASVKISRAATGYARRASKRTIDRTHPPHTLTANSPRASDVNGPLPIRSTSPLKAETLRTPGSKSSPIRYAIESEEHDSETTRTSKPRS